MKSDDINAKPDLSIFNEKIAIVMQGPIVHNHDFTLETLKIYRKRFPKIIIILSTWENYSKDELDMFRIIDVRIIENTKPKYSGFANINLQIESARNGVLRANEMGAQYCLRTRTDQRIYRHDFIQYFISLIKIFPTQNSKKLKGRLISVSLNTFKYRLYGVTDMLTFGYIEDMLLFWNVEYDLRKKDEIDLGQSVLDWSRARTCEVYLTTKFLEKIRHTPLYTLKDSWDVFSKYFCVVDRSSIDLFWYKYNRWDENQRYVNSNRKLDEELAFSDWINMVNNNSIYKEEYEKSLYRDNMSSIK